MVPIVTLMTPFISALAPKFLSVLNNKDKGPVFAQEVKNFVDQSVSPIDETADEDTQEAQVAAAIDKVQSDPRLSEQMLAMMIEAERDLTRTHVEDLRHARELRTKVDSHQPQTLLYMSFGLLVLIIGLVAGLIWLAPTLPDATTDPGGRDFIIQISGTAIGFLTSIGGMFARNIGSAFDFWFGSSAGSKVKSEQISEVLEKQQEAPVVVPTVDVTPAGKSVEEHLADFRKGMSAAL